MWDSALQVPGWHVVALLRGQDSSMETTSQGGSALGEKVLMPVEILYVTLTS